MITRVWQGRTGLDKADQYLNFLLNEGTEEYRQTSGNASVKVWSKREQTCCHFLTVTEWKDLASVKTFAGEEYEKAKYYLQDDGVLLEFEEKVEHYDCHDVGQGRISNLLDQLGHLYAGGGWLGESFVDKLGDVNEELAFKEPLPGVHCIAEIVWHCVYWRTVLIKRLEGDSHYKEQTVKELNFLPISVLKAKTWVDLKRLLDESQGKLLGLLGSRRDEFLDDAYEAGFTYDYLLRGMIQHDAYHLGQIGLVKKMIRLGDN